VESRKKRKFSKMSAFESLRKNNAYSNRQAAGCNNGRTEENLRGPVAVSHRTWQNNPTYLIFDNHPASVRLLLGSDPAPRRRNEFLYVVLAIVFVLATGLGMFWPLL
jgi:hypothetical protein